MLSDAVLASGGDGREGGGNVQQEGTVDEEEGVSGGSTSRERDAADAAYMQWNKREEHAYLLVRVHVFSSLSSSSHSATVLIQLYHSLACCSSSVLQVRRCLQKSKTVASCRCGQDGERARRPCNRKIVFKEKKHRSEKLQSYGPAPHLPSSKSSSEFEDILALFVSCASRPACV